MLWFSEGAAETVAVCRHHDGSAWIHYSDGRGASGTTSFRGGWLYAHVPLSALKLLKSDPAVVQEQSEAIKARYTKLFGV